MWEEFAAAPLGVHIAYYIAVGVTYSLILFGFVICILYAKKLKEKRNAYIRTLNEHDRLVVTDYKSLDVKFSDIFKK